MGMNFQEATFYETFYLHQDHAVDALDLIVFQNDHREPVVEVLVQLEGNTIQGDVQAAIGQYIPGWDTERTRYTADGHLYYNKTPSGELDRSSRVQCKSGLPKVHLAIADNVDRMHMINIAAHLETTSETKTEVHLRVMDPHRRQKSQRTKLWKERKEQIVLHLTEDDDITQQMNIEMSTFMDPLQTMVNGRYQGKDIINA